MGQQFSKHRHCELRNKSHSRSHAECVWRYARRVWGREPAAPFGIGEITVVRSGGISSRQRNGKKRAQLFKRALKLLGLVLGAAGGAIWLPERPTDYVSSRAIAIPIPPPTKPRPDQDLARGVWAEGAAEDVPHEEFFDVPRLHAGPLHRRFAPRHRRKRRKSCRTAS
jgi:hypothetical protein